MKFIKRILLIAIFCFAVLAIIGQFLPTAFSVTRSVLIDSTPQEIHKYTGDLSNWDSWSPWLEKDPSIKITRSDQTTGVGATQSWSGKDGIGTLVFKSSDPIKGVEYDMDFNEGQFISKADFKYIPKGDQTEVVWTMSGNCDTPIIGGFFARKMDSFVGPDFELGLKNLKTIVEAN